MAFEISKKFRNFQLIMKSFDCHKSLSKFDIGSPCLRIDSSSVAVSAVVAAERGPALVVAVSGR